MEFNYSPKLRTGFYLSIIAWEKLTVLPCWRGGVRMLASLNEDASVFHHAERVPIIGLTLSLLMWLVAFLSVGSEWFLMWHSKEWNGQDAAFRMFTVIGIVLVLLVQPDAQDQP